MSRQAKSERRGLRDAAKAFHHRNFALFWTGAVLSNTGSWVQNVTVPFVVFKLTGSAGWLGVAGFAQLFPAWLMGPAGGGGGGPLPPPAPPVVDPNRRGLPEPPPAASPAAPCCW